MTHEIEGARLLVLARESIAHHLGGPSPDMPTGAFYEQKAATFVTLTREGDLHGCIGSIEPVRPLVEDVRHNAIAAAFFDPRSRPLRADELDAICVEVSLLGPLEPMRFADEDEARSLLRPGEDGVVLVHGRRRATFLPQVWDKLPDKIEFMAHLKIKAGLYPDFWSPSIELFRYSLEKWSEDSRASA